MPYADIREDRRRAKRKRLEDIAAGRCLYCHKEPPIPGKRRCEACSAKVRASQRKYMARKRQAAKVCKICTQCLRQEAIPGRSCCGYCQEYQEEYHQRRKARRKK